MRGVFRGSRVQLAKIFVFQSFINVGRFSLSHSFTFSFFSKLPSPFFLHFSFLLPWNSFKLWLDPLMVSCFLPFLYLSPSMEGELSFLSLFLPLIYPRWVFVIEPPTECHLACIPWAWLDGIFVWTKSLVELKTLFFPSLLQNLTWGESL